MSKEDPEQCLLIGGEPIEFEPAHHELKVWSEYFWAIGEGKEFELRKDDRDYKVGDLVRLREYLPVAMTYTGVQIDRRISYILRGPEAERFGLQPGYCILGLARPNQKIRPRVGMCGDGRMTGTLDWLYLPGGLGAGKRPLYCGLPAEHAGVHHDRESGAHWTSDGEIVVGPSKTGW